MTSTGIRIGQKGNVDYFTGSCQVAIFYTADKSADRAAIETALNDYFNIY
jgi:hypothetical protein